MMRETRKATFPNRDFGQEEAGETRARRLRDPRIVVPALAGSGWDQSDRPACGTGLQNPTAPAHQPPLPGLDALPDTVLDSLPWPGQPQNRPPAWMLEEDPPETAEPKQPPAASAYEQEWNTLRPQVQNPWHSMDDEERKMLIHPVELEKEPAIGAEVMQREMEKPAKSGFHGATEPMSGDKSNVRPQADTGMTVVPQPQRVGPNRPAPSARTNFSGVAPDPDPAPQPEGTLNTLHQLPGYDPEPGINHTGCAVQQM